SISSRRQTDNQTEGDDQIQRSLHSLHGIRRAVAAEAIHGRDDPRICRRILDQVRTRRIIDPKYSPRSVEYLIGPFFKDAIRPGLKPTRVVQMLAQKIECEKSDAEGQQKNDRKEKDLFASNRQAAE